ncbi:MAG: D-alanyl-D-alanine carboxypeptidase family protein [Clostridium sp.]
MKRILASLLVGIMLVLAVMPSVNANTLPSDSKKVENKEQKPEGGMKLNCKSAVLVDPMSGKVLYEYNSHEKFAPASVTKVMTMLLTMEGVDNGTFKLSDKVTVSEKAQSMGGSTMFLEAGEVRTVEDLLKGIAVESANDAAVCLAEFIGGSEDEFATLMNKKAQMLGMKNSNFVNSYGFYDENHYTTAYDIALMSRELLKHPKILDYTKIWMETISEGRKEPFTLTNRNKMIKHYSGCDGLKTGYIKEAMFCISSTAKRGDVRMLSVVMGAPSWKERNAQAGALLDYGFSKVASQKVLKKGDVVKEVKIEGGKPAIVKAIASEDLVALTEKGKKINITTKIELNKDMKLPLKKGDKIGKVVAVDGSEIYGSVDLIIDQNVEKAGYLDMLKGSFKSWLNLK